MERSWVERHPVLASLVIVIPVILLPMVVSPFFDTNDDTWMMLTLSGRATSVEPTEHVIFLNAVLARALTALYRTAPGAPWYGWLHVVSIALASWAMLYAMLARHFSVRRLCLFLVCFLFFAIPFVISLQFTKTAFLVGLAGIFLLYTALLAHLSGEGGPARTVFRVIVAGLLLLLSFAMRKESLLLVGVLSAPLLVDLGWKARRSGALAAPLGSIAGIGVLLLALVDAHARAYRAPEWQTCNEILPLKSWFTDYNRVPYNRHTKEVFDDVGWSENDYWMMVFWFYVDPATYSPEKLEAIVSRFPAMSLRTISPAVSALAVGLIREPLFWVATPLLIGIAFLGGFTKRRDAGIVLVATVVLALSVMVFMVAFLKLPQRVSQPILTAPCWLALLLAKGRDPGPEPDPEDEDEGEDEEDESRPGRRLEVAGILLVVLSVLLVLFMPRVPHKFALGRSRFAVQENRDLRAALQRLDPRPSQTIVAWGATFPYSAILPMEPKDYLRDLRIVAVGSSNQSPVQQRMLDAQGIDDVVRALFERDDVFITPAPVSAGNVGLRRYIDEHYRVPVEITTHFQEGPLHLLRVSRIGAGR